MHADMYDMSVSVCDISQHTEWHLILLMSRELEQTGRPPLITHTYTYTIIHLHVYSSSLWFHGFLCHIYI